jgi:hypothetical protein
LRRAFGVITRAGLPASAEGAVQGKHEVAGHLAADDVVLVKASRAARLDEVAALA